VSATAPIVDLTTVQVDVCREQTREGRQGRGAVLAFLVGAGLIKLDGILNWEVGSVIHADLRTWSVGLEYYKLREESVP